MDNFKLLELIEMRNLFAFKPGSLNIVWEERNKPQLPAELKQKDNEACDIKATFL